MAWRRNKVRELLAKGYTQHDIASTLHISQPTISRDIGYVKKGIRKKTENIDEHLLDVYRNNLLGLDEIIKKLWSIIDSPKTNNKERIKAIILVRECYNERFELSKYGASLISQKNYVEKVKSSGFY
jgi:predicted transcriptional regulator